jgi:hypothetical protein
MRPSCTAGLIAVGNSSAVDVDDKNTTDNATSKRSDPCNLRNLAIVQSVVVDGWELYLMEGNKREHSDIARSFNRSEATFRLAEIWGTLAETCRP